MCCGTYLFEIWGHLAKAQLMEKLSESESKATAHHCRY